MSDKVFGEAVHATPLRPCQCAGVSEILNSNQIATAGVAPVSNLKTTRRNIGFLACERGRSMWRELAEPHHSKVRSMNPVTAAILNHDFCSPGEVRRILRTGRNATYNALKCGDIPSLRIGGVIKVPTAWVRTKLGIEAAQ
jgi:hypothetical protein